MPQNNRPYKLPEPLTCSTDLVVNGVSMDLASQYITKHEDRLPRYNYLEKLYKGFYDIYNQPEKGEWKPDNRLSANFPRYITETFMGYAYGIPIKKTHPDEEVLEEIKKFDDNNDMTDHEYELFKETCIYGHAWEYFYQDEEAETKVTICTPKELFVVYDDTMRHRALFAVRYGYHDADSSNPYKIFGEIMTREKIESFEGNKKTGSSDNPYGLIPCVEYKMNDERMGLYEEVTSMVETYNHVLAEKANDVDAFADAYLAVLGAEIDEDGYHKIRDNRLINLYGTDDANKVVVDFLQKPTADGTQENLMDRLEDLIYETSMVANISDDSFGSNVSGTSLAYKMQSMSNLAMGFDRKIEKSMRKRYKIWATLPTNTSDPDAWKQIDFTTSRNLPKNLLEEAQTAQALEGIVSKDTQLQVLSIVKDTADEVDKLNAEEARLTNGQLLEE